MVVNYGPTIHSTYSGDKLRKFKRLITNKFKIKSAVPYDNLLNETETAPIEAIAMVLVIMYLKKLNKWKKVDGLRLSLMIDCARAKKLECSKITNGLVNGEFS